MNNRKIFFTFILLIFLLTSLTFAVEKRSIGILPFENMTNQKKYDWVGFGIQYLLSNKLSNISEFYVPDQSIIKPALKDAAYGTKRIDGEMVYHVGKSTGINIGITGTYATNGKTIELELNFINAFNGATILSKQYKNNFSDLFTIADDIAQNLIQLAAVVLSQQEADIVNRQMTNSIKAFENFCLGYIENEKPKKYMEVIVGLFKKAIRADAKFWEAYYNLGIAYFNDKNYDGALRQFDIIISSLPNFEKPYFGRAMIYLRKKQYEKARADFVRVTDFNPNDYKPFFYLGQINVFLKKYKDADKNLKKAAEINPDYGPIYFEMGNIYFLQKKYRLAIPHYKKSVQLDPGNYDCRQRLGECFYRVQTYYSAYTEFKKILEAQPTNPEANFMLGITAYKQAVLSELIEAFLEMFDPEVAKQQRTKSKQSGAVRERQVVYQEMADAFDRAQKSRAGFVEATFNLALTYHEMAEYDKSQSFYQKAIQLQPTLVRAHIKLAKLYEDRNQKEKALAKYKEVVGIDPSYFVTHPTLGAMHNYINILDIVLRELDQKLKANPNDVNSNLTLAKIYYAQGFNGKAANLFRKILSINPNDREAKKMLAKMERK